jgi:hypothetical protein
MISTSRLLALGLSLQVLAPSASARFRLLEMKRPSSEEIQRMRASGAYEFLELTKETVRVVEDVELLQSFSLDERVGVQMFRGAYRIEKQDLDEVFAPFREKGSEGAYHSFQEVQDEVKALADANPERVELVEIGRSYEDRPLTAVRVGLRDGVERPKAIFMGMIHAREWISTEMAMAFLNKLVAPGDDQELRDLLDRVEVYVIPILNPDGLIHSQTEYTWWRGNRRVNADGSIGVDLNRNFPTGWGIGSSSRQGSQTYRGASPLSEPETKAFDDFVAAQKPVLSMTWHAYGRMALLPFGYVNGEPARQDLYAEIGPRLRQATGYRTGPIHDIIGLVGGSTDDHFLVAHGTFVATLELGTSFIPRENQIESTLAEAMPGAMIWLKSVPILQGIDPRKVPTLRESRFR